jgi:stage V sporulation protein B
MAMPLIFFPALVTSSLATTLVPAISEAVSLKNFKSVNYRISKSIQITFILGFLFTAVFASYPNEIGNLIYRRERIGDLLQVLSYSCVLIYLQQTLTGVLNGLGKQGVLLRNTVIGSVIRIGFVYFLIPVYGIKSYIWGISVSFLITDALNLFAVTRMTGLLINLRQWILGPAVVGVFLIIIGRYIFGFFQLFTGSMLVVTLLSLIFIVVLGLLLMVAVGAIKRNEIIHMHDSKKMRKR